MADAEARDVLDASGYAGLSMAARDPDAGADFKRAAASLYVLGSWTLIMNKKRGFLGKFTPDPIATKLRRALPTTEDVDALLVSPLVDDPSLLTFVESQTKSNGALKAAAVNVLRVWESDTIRARVPNEAPSVPPVPPPVEDARLTEDEAKALSELMDPETFKGAVYDHDPLWLKDMHNATLTKERRIRELFLRRGPSATIYHKIMHLAKDVRYITPYICVLGRTDDDWSPRL